MPVLVFVIFAFLAGCFCGIKVDAINTFFMLSGFCFIFAVKLVIFKKKTVANLFVVILIVCFCCGTALGIYHDKKTFSKIKYLYGTDITVTGKVTDVNGQNFAVDTQYGGLWVYNYMSAVVENGNIVEIKGYVDAFETTQYNGGFDSRVYNALHGIVGNITCQEVKVTGNDESFSVWNIGTDVRTRIENIVQKSNATERNKGFIIALLTGSTDALDEGVKQAFKITGISHLTAVSGLHVGIFLSFFVIFSRGLRGNKIIHFLFILALVVMYIILIGERASVFRAGIMTVVSYMMFSIKRRSDSLINLMIAGLLICFVNPYYVTDPGFQMSFMATLGLVLFAEYFKYQVIAVPVIASVFMLPITLYYYNSFSFTTVPVNVVAVFLVTFVVLMGYIGCLVPMFLYVACAISEIIISVAEFFASMEYLHFTLPSPDARQFLMWIFVVAAVWFFVNKRQYRKMAMMLFISFLVGLNGIVSGMVEEKNCKVRFMNCGKFNMQHITTENGKEIFVDCGYKACDYAVKSGTNQIYAVFVTDDNESRYIGIEQLCVEQNVKYVILPDNLREKNLKLEKSNVLYYNQGSYNFFADEVAIKSVDGENGLYVSVHIYDDVIVIPSDKTISDEIFCDVMCVPDGCEDSALAYEGMKADFYIHPTHRYQYYDYGNKYITSQAGMIQMIFSDESSPVLVKS